MRGLAGGRVAVALAHGEIHGLANLVAQRLHDAARLHPQIDPSQRAAAEFGQLAAEPVEAVGITLDEAVVGQRPQDAKGGGGMQAGLRRDHFKARATGIFPKHIKELGHAIDDLDTPRFGCHGPLHFVL